MPTAILVQAQSIHRDTITRQAQQHDPNAPTCASPSHSHTHCWQLTRLPTAWRVWCTHLPPTNALAIPFLTCGRFTPMPELQTNTHYTHTHSSQTDRQTNTHDASRRIARTGNTHQHESNAFDSPLPGWVRADDRRASRQKACVGRG